MVTKDAIYPNRMASLIGFIKTNQMEVHHVSNSCYNWIDCYSIADSSE